MSEQAIHDRRKAQILASSQLELHLNLYDVVKRLFDTTFALITLPLLMPLMVFIAILIKLDSPGPAFFAQRRIGRWGHPFYILKFRTMTHSIDDMAYRKFMQAFVRGDLDTTSGAPRREAEDKLALDVSVQQQRKAHFQEELQDVSSESSKTALFGDTQTLLRQTTFAWLQLPLGVIAFTVIALVFSMFIQDRETVVMGSFVVVMLALIMVHILLKKRDYRPVHTEELSPVSDSGERLVSSKTVIYKPFSKSMVTRVGRILRKTSLDEIPQLFNVLKGEMSVVGPRPNVPYEVEVYREWHKERLAVLPGITGLAQVRGRSALDFDSIARYDIEYARNWSLALDIKIMWQTIVSVFQGNRAR